MLSDDDIRERLAKYGVEASGPQCEQTRAYIALLLKWNRAISLTTITDEADILRFHFGESVFALSAINAGVHGRLADVGAGAGFPGLPLRIFSDRIELVLIESNSKKCAFLGEVARQLGLTGVRVLHDRYDEALQALSGRVDVVVSRALGDYVELLNSASHALSTGGGVVLWLGDRGAKEIRATDGWTWDACLQIPGSERRFLLHGFPLRAASQ